MAARFTRRMPDEGKLTRADREHGQPRRGWRASSDAAEILCFDETDYAPTVQLVRAFFVETFLGECASS